MAVIVPYQPIAEANNAFIPASVQLDLPERRDLWVGVGSPFGVKLSSSRLAVKFWTASESECSDSSSWGIGDDGRTSSLWSTAEPLTLSAWSSGESEVMESLSCGILDGEILLR